MSAGLQSHCNVMYRPARTEVRVSLCSRRRRIYFAFYTPKQRLILPYILEFLHFICESFVIEITNP